LADALRREADAQAQSNAHPDLLEGVLAIEEKRRPSFS
jgi:enoyl-CoA hydratase/carnithine racemase